jgi:hypothetical protein
MLQVTATDELRVTDLVSLLDATELRDENGELIGYFIPGNLDSKREIYAQAIAKLDRDTPAQNGVPSGPGRTLDEFKHVFESEETARAHLAKLRAEKAETTTCPTP